HYLAFLLIPAPPPTEIYPLSLHDALPISRRAGVRRGRRHHEAVLLRRLRPRPSVLLPRFDHRRGAPRRAGVRRGRRHHEAVLLRSEEHTSELQSRSDLVCRLLLEKKKKRI